MLEPTASRFLAPRFRGGELPGDQVTSGECTDEDAYLALGRDHERINDDFSFWPVDNVGTVKPNRSIPSPTVIPVLIYPDVREAVSWLSSAFGFQERLQIGESHRSQLRVGDGAVIVADVRHDQRPPRPGEVTHSVLVRVDDARAHCERARSHGAQILMEPTDFEYGERQYAAEDPAGHRWTFSETLDDVEPKSWGGILLESSS
jgi:uncharacterized glyoxalase superfamily protein PhnB